MKSRRPPRPTISPALKEELGDLLLQVVFHSRMAEEAGRFAFDDVARAISDKMVTRHPHVFAATEIADAAAQTVAWEELKANERAAKGAASALDGVGPGCPPSPAPPSCSAAPPVSASTGRMSSRSSTRSRRRSPSCAMR